MADMVPTFLVVAVLSAVLAVASLPLTVKLVLTLITGIFMVAVKIKAGAKLSTAAEAAEASRQQWDYIIIGGGTAGCLLANRLTAPKLGKKVLVLEAGSADYNHPMVQVPAGVLKLFQSDKDWNFFTTNETKTSGRGIYLCRGKVLGGSSAVNVLLYTRGDKEDYDTWASEYGCLGWSAKDVLPLFKRHEDDNTGAASKDPNHHSVGGEWSVETVRYQNPLSKMFLQACKQAGFPENDDFNSFSKKQEGSGRFPVSQRGGKRVHAATAFLAPALEDSKRKLQVLTGTLVRQVILDDNVAKGVQFDCDKMTHVVRLAPGGEVLLTAGAIHSPHILMLSGIGPEKMLKEHGINLVKDLPGVGENLQDQPAANVSFECKDKHSGISVTSKIKVPHTTLPHPAPVLEWLLQKTGPLCSTGCDHGGFFHTSAAPKNSSSCDLQMRFLAARAVTADGMGSFTRFKHIIDHPDGFSFQSVAVRPASRGRVSLASANPEEKPVVEGNYLTDKQDYATLREGIRLGRKLAKQAAFKDHLGEEYFPGAHVQTDAELDAYISDSTHTANAVVGTCRMGSLDDPATVVDPQLKVKGISGLRVCDSSVIPKLPGAQSGACTLMIAEKAAELLLK